MQLDIRLPLGLLFLIFGLVLTCFGFFSDKKLYQRSLSIDINLWWGAAPLLFEAFLFALGRRDSVERE